MNSIMRQSGQLLLVVGNGRSGTSLMSKALETFGARIPRPEISKDNTNPSGFGESRWLVEFHQQLLWETGLWNSNAQPDAPSIVRSHLSNKDHRLARNWLSKFISPEAPVLLKDPRMLWFLDFWADVGLSLDLEVVAIHMFRDPLSTVASNRRWYSDNPGWNFYNRLGGWINGVAAVDGLGERVPLITVDHQSLIDDPITTVTKAWYRLGVRPESREPGSDLALAKLVNVEHDHSSSPNSIDSSWLERELSRISGKVYKSLRQQAASTDSVLEFVSNRRLLFEEYSRLYVGASSLARPSRRGLALLRSPRIRTARNLFWRWLVFRAGDTATRFLWRVLGVK